ncbi:MAG: hypothetical protein KDA49_03020 [Rhodospirillaceae bacterium]|nr:hypothetical protein [Rhodospirillaceae bacterium]
MSNPEDPKQKPTLSDGDIVTRPMGRRRMMGLSVGVGVGTAGLVLGTSNEALATTDNDNGYVTDPGGRGRGYCRGFSSGVTDADRGNITDPGGNGRGGPGQRRPGITDVDNGPWTDPGGQGRGNSRAWASGITDSDTGGVCRDPVGNGRNV